MRDRWLPNVAGGREVAGAGLARDGELADDGEAGGIGEGGQEPNLGIWGGGAWSSCHDGSISAIFDIDNHRYVAHYIDGGRYRDTRPRKMESWI